MFERFKMVGEGAGIALAVYVAVRAGAFMLNAPSTIAVIIGVILLLMCGYGMGEWIWSYYKRYLKEDSPTQKE